MKKIDYLRIVDSHLATNEAVLKENFSSDRHIFVAPVCSLRKGGYIVFDFGEERCARFHIVFGYGEAAKIRIRLGESASEVYMEEGEKGAGNHHSLRDASYPAVSWNDFSSSETGFRFARVDVIEGEVANIVSVYVENSDNGLTSKGEFLSSDKRLNEIFEVASKTISLCVRPDAIWDGIKRDRIEWIGDFYPELLSASFVYGNIPQFKKMLDTASSFDGRWIDNIPAYSAWWLICLEKYYRISGDASYVDKMKGYIAKIQKDFMEIVLPEGKVSYANSKLTLLPSNEFFLDWPTNLTPDAEIGWRYLLIIAMKKTISLSKRFGFSCEGAKTVLSRLEEYEYKPSSFKQVTALGVLAGMIEPSEGAKLIKKDGAKGVSAFLSFAIVEALSLANEDESAVSLIKEYYGAMIDLGASAFFEDFDIEWLRDNPSGVADVPDPKRKNIHADYGKFCYQGHRHSLCHGWSTGFLDFYLTRLLGIVPLEEGYKTIKVEPHLCGLSFVQGKVPTPYGEIYVKHISENGHIKTELKLPEGIKSI